MDRVFLTGADGFTGRYVAPLLAARGFEVHGFATHAPEDPVLGVTELHLGDLTDPNRLTSVVSEISPRHVIHLGGVAFVQGDPEPMYAVNLLGTRKLLEALIALDQAPQTVLLASSANVYGNSTEGVLDESTPPQPANDYAISKLAMEHVAATYASRLPIVICRPFNYTGVGQSERFLLPKIVSHVRRRATRIELGNLHVTRDFSDVRDIATIYAALLETPAAIGTTLNLCSGQGYTLMEILADIETISGWKMDVAVNPAFVRANEVKVLLGSRDRLKSLLPNVAPPIPLSSTLAWMLDGSLPG